MQTWMIRGIGHAMAPWTRLQWASSDAGYFMPKARDSICAEVHSPWRTTGAVLNIQFQPEK